MCLAVFVLTGCRQFWLISVYLTLKFVLMCKVLIVTVWFWAVSSVMYNHCEHFFFVRLGSLAKTDRYFPHCHLPIEIIFSLIKMQIHLFAPKLTCTVKNAFLRKVTNLKVLNTTT